MRNLQFKLVILLIAIISCKESNDQTKVLNYLSKNKGEFIKTFENKDTKLSIKFLPFEALIVENNIYNDPKLLDDIIKNEIVECRFILEYIADVDLIKSLDSISRMDHNALKSFISIPTEEMKLIYIEPIIGNVKNRWSSQLIINVSKQNYKEFKQDPIIQFLFPEQAAKIELKFKKEIINNIPNINKI